MLLVVMRMGRVCHTEVTFVSRLSRDTGITHKVIGGKYIPDRASNMYKGLEVSVAGIY